ncbi:aminopeptidase P family protein [uncultured Haemophilus sp.]|uniref:aminopeptidase P family protein n=1 Tax=uncultured Haemophilus sp. TaxID=237779 RepID=UPI002804FC19|nr:aminopeptidase P family protein [uncultured Haemophilus sp.]
MSHISELRRFMAQNQIDAWIIPSADPHLSEYLPEHWQARRYFSGFTGSVGTLVVTAEQAGLWVDSRYWEQAAAQLEGSGIALCKLGVTDDYPQWLLGQLTKGAKVGVAADMLSVALHRRLLEVFAEKSLHLTLFDSLPAELWKARPNLPRSTVYPHLAAFVAQSTSEKLAHIRHEMQRLGADWHLISSLDDIAWLTNLRADDVPYNPVFLAYLLIGKNSALLFVDDSRLNDEARTRLSESAITCMPYEALGQQLAALPEVQSLLLDPAKTAMSSRLSLPSTMHLIEDLNPSSYAKSIKSAAELAHLRETMAQDGAALCRFYAELEAKLAAGQCVTEWDIDGMLLASRRLVPHFISHSFGTIAAFNANAALPHYSASEQHSAQITGNGLLLIDCGGQYQGGTTDITRVSPIGTPSDAQKTDFTRVLQAHIALAEAVFPEGIGAPLLDAIGREKLWRHQCNYGHGTGHGVGFFLNVHEGPQVISYHSAVTPQTAMREGMVTSNEPGLYRPGKWGIRIENLVANRMVSRPQETDFGRFMYFETLTLFPIDSRLIVRELLTQNEIDWLNDYHLEVREKLLPLVEGAAKAWLIERTEAI